MTLTTERPCTTDADAWRSLAGRLRLRDDDPAYADAPVLDAYARLSKSPDSGSLEVTDRQLLDILSSVAGRHARLGEVHRDDNLSAWDTKVRRPGWQRLLDRLESRAASGAVCWHSDRLMRQPRDLERLIDLAERRGVILGSCFGDHDLGSADGRFTLRVLTASAAKASDDTSRRQKRKAASMREAGRVGGGGARAFGCPGSVVLSPQERAAMKAAGVEIPQVDAALVAREREAIAWGVAAHLDGVAVRAITREWNARGLLTARDGVVFTGEQCRRVLQRARNAGLIEYDGVVVGRLADVQPIITLTQFEAIRARFAGRKPGRPASDRYLLSGLARCALCDAAMSGSARRSHGASGYGDDLVLRYRCHPSYGCGRVQINGAKAEAWVRTQVVEILSDPLHAKQIARSSVALAKVEQAIVREEETGVELSARLGEGRMTLDRYDAATGPLDKRLAVLRTERAALLVTGAGAQARTRDRAEVAAEWDALIAEGSTDALRVLVTQALPLGVAVGPAVRKGPARDAGERMSRRV